MAAESAIGPPRQLPCFQPRRSASCPVMGTAARSGERCEFDPSCHHALVAFQASLLALQWVAGLDHLPVVANRTTPRSIPTMEDDWWTGSSISCSVFLPRTIK